MARTPLTLGVLLLCVVGSSSLDDRNGDFIGNLKLPEGGSVGVHEVRGDVYAIDRRTLKIKGMNYDGAGPYAFFVVSKYLSNRWSTVKKSSFVKIPDETGTSSVGEQRLKAYKNQDIILEFPENVDGDFSSYESFGVHCITHNHPFGAVDLNKVQWKERAKCEVTAENVKYDFVNSQTLLIKLQSGAKLGDVKSAEFVKGAMKTPLYLDPSFGKFAFRIMDDSKTFVDYTSGGYSISLKDSRGQETTVAMTSLFSGDCAKLRLPTPVQHCVELAKDFLQFSYARLNYTTLQFRILANITMEKRWVAVGISGKSDTFSMVGADHWLVYAKKSKPMVKDFYNSERSQCNLETMKGACEDPKGSQNLKMISGEYSDGIINVVFDRPFQTGDSKTDKEIPMEPGTKTQLVWGTGPLLFSGDTPTPLIHNKKITKNTEVDFVDYKIVQCPPLAGGGNGFMLEDPWIIHDIHGNEVDNTFTVEIGQAGSYKGYDAITGMKGWGITYYINQKLIPRLVLKRGETFKFKLYVGGKSNHPFLITNDKEGRLLDRPRGSDSTIYAGYNFKGDKTIGISGTICTYNRKKGLKLEQTDRAKTFKEFFSYLERTCDQVVDGAEYSTMTFTPTADTPDLLYYQCWIHAGLGWQIKIVDEYPKKGAASLQSFAAAVTSVIALSVVRACYVTFKV